MLYFTLDEEHQLQPCSHVLEWALWMAEAGRFGSTTVGDVVLALKDDRVWVSTVFLGTGLALFETLIETAVTGELLRHPSVVKRYASWEAAIAGHAEQVSFFEALGYTPLEVSDAAVKD